MKLALDRLTATPRHLCYEITPPWWSARVPVSERDATALDRPLTLELSAYRAGADVVLEGRLAGEVAATCSRCLARYRHPLRDAFRLVLEPAGDRVPADPEGAALLAREGLWLGDELEAGWFQGNEIDLTSLLLEVVALAMPVKPLCREECAGLCPRCGVDRNQEPCRCETTRPDSPFAVLARLRGD